jgi:hypothetical protein
MVTKGEELLEKILNYDIKSLNEILKDEERRKGEQIGLNEDELRYLQDATHNIDPNDFYERFRMSFENPITNQTIIEYKNEVSEEKKLFFSNGKRKFLFELLRDMGIKLTKSESNNIKVYKLHYENEHWQNALKASINKIYLVLGAKSFIDLPGKAAPEQLPSPIEPKETPKPEDKVTDPDDSKTKPHSESDIEEAIKNYFSNGGLKEIEKIIKNYVSPNGSGNGHGDIYIYVNGEEIKGGNGRVKIDGNGKATSDYEINQDMPVYLRELGNKIDSMHNMLASANIESLESKIDNVLSGYQRMQQRVDAAIPAEG